MGTELTKRFPEAGDVLVVPWLDDETRALVRSIVVSVARRHADLQAVILYGSVARRDERPLTEPDPSDVDLLFVFGSDVTRFSLAEELAISESIGLALDHHPHAPREVEAMFASPELREWDQTFVANVARDGLLLWTRGPLPSRLAAIASRTPPPVARAGASPERTPGR